MDAGMMRVTAVLVVLLSLQGCGVSGDAGDDPGNTNSPTNESASGSGDATGPGSNDGSAATSGSGDTDAAGGFGMSSGGDTGGVTVVLPDRLTINLPFPCPASQNSVDGCWVSEVCSGDVNTNSSKRNVLRFEAGKLSNMFIEWGTPGCPADVTPGITGDASPPDFVLGAQVETTNVGVVGYLLDLDQGKTKTVAGDIPQLHQYGVQRMCFHVGHYDPATGIDPNAQRVAQGPFVIDNTLCLQRHLNE